MGSRRQRHGLCVYCGQESALTRDHVVPLALFRRPYPTNPVVIDACLPCNRLKGKSDEYLRDFLTMDFRGSQSPTAHEIFESKVRRSHRRNSSELIRKAMQTIRVEPLYTRGGVYLGHFPQAYVDDDRLFQVLGMMVRGLFYDAKKERLPDDCRVTVNRHDPWDYASIFHAFDLPSKPSTRAIGDVFRCAFQWATEDPRLTLWLLLFYGRVLFSAITEPTIRGPGVEA